MILAVATRAVLPLLALAALACGAPAALPASAPAAGTSTASPTAAPASTNARLRFRSGFEEGVTLGAPVLRFGQWRQELAGADAGFDWATALGGRPTDFQYLVSGTDARDAAELRRFVETRIDSVPGRDGRPTRALYQALRGKGSIGQTQNDFIIFDMPEAAAGYVRYWLKLQPDLLDVMAAAGDWRVLFEWKETPQFTTLPPGIDFQYRWLVLLSRHKPNRESPVDAIVWKVEGDIVTPDLAAKGTPWTDDWTLWNRELRVPLGEWFRFEAYWRLAPDGGGRLVVWADGRLVADARQRTQAGWARGKLYLMENYVGAEPLRRGETYQWIDDLELWTDVPDGVVLPR